MLRFDLRAMQSTLVPGEPALVSLALHNRGTEPVSVPHPLVYSNDQPLWVARSGSVVTRRTPRMAASGAAPVEHSFDPHAELLTLGPGERFEGAFDLASLRCFPGPGAYAVRATLRFHDVDVASNEILITVAAPAPVRAAVELYRDLWGGLAARVAWLHQGPKTRVPVTMGPQAAPSPSTLRVLFGSMLTLAPDHDGLPVLDSMTRAPVDLTATADLVPLEAFRPLLAPAPPVWIDGDHLRTLAPGGPIAHAPLPGCALTVVPRALAGEEPLDLDVVLIAERPGEVTLVAVRLGGLLAGDPGAETLFQVPLARRPDRARVASARHTAAGRHLAMAVEGGAEIALEHARFTARTPPASFTGLAVPRGQLVPEGDDLAVFEDAEGRAHVILLARSADDLGRLLLAEAIVGGEGAATITLTPVDLGGEIRAASVAVYDEPGRAPAWLWAARLADGRVFAALPGGAPRLVRERSSGPLVITLAGADAYLLELRPDRGPTLVPLALPG